MAIALTHLTGGTVTTNGGATGTITSTTGKVFLTVAVSAAGGSITAEDDTIAISGGGVTWNLVGANKLWGGRRGTYCFLSSGKPSSGTVTITWTSGPGGQIWEQFKYSADEVTGEDSSTPTGTVYYTDVVSGAAVAVTVSETPDAGDFVFFATGLEDNNDTARGAELDTDLYELGDSTGSRHFHVAYDSSPDATPAPSVTWTGSCSAGALAFIINVGAGGAAPTMTISETLSFAEALD